MIARLACGRYQDALISQRCIGCGICMHIYSIGRLPISHVVAHSLKPHQADQVGLLHLSSIAFARLCFTGIFLYR